MSPRSVLIVGAGLAGYSTARGLRQAGYDGAISIVGEEPERPYDRTPLSKELLAGAVDESALALEPDGEDLQAEWVLGVGARRFDPATRSLTLADGAELSADAVVLATGAVGRRPTYERTDVHVVRHLDDVRALRRDLVPGARLAVVGAGFIGAEIAATARGLGHEVTVVEQAPAPLAGPLGAELGAAVAELHQRHGVELICGVPVVAVTERGLTLADDRQVAADVVVAAIGSQPALGWLAGSGLDQPGGIPCSTTGATDVPGVWAVGDCAAWWDPAYGRHHRTEHWTDARDRPAALVAALLGHPAPDARAPYFWSDQYGTKIQYAGWRRGDETITIEAGSAEGGDLLAVYRRPDGEPAAALGMDQPRLFTRLRKALQPPLPAPTRRSA